MVPSIAAMPTEQRIGIRRLRAQLADVLKRVGQSGTPYVVERAGEPIHVVWGIPAGQDSPAVLVTAYRPDPGKWDETWRGRRL